MHHILPYGLRASVTGRRQRRGRGAPFRDQYSQNDSGRHHPLGILSRSGRSSLGVPDGFRPPATEKDWLIKSFAIAIVVGTGLSGGSISSPGILMGAVIIVLIKNSLVMLDANVCFEQSFLGSIILVAVILNRARELWAKK